MEKRKRKKEDCCLTHHICLQEFRQAERDTFDIDPADPVDECQPQDQHTVENTVKDGFGLTDIYWVLSLSLSLTRACVHTYICINPHQHTQGRSCLTLPAFIYLFSFSFSFWSSKITLSCRKGNCSDT